jgi:hypothetical protein
MPMKITPPKETDAKLPQVELAELEIVPKHPFRLVIVGTSGSGKSVLTSHLVRNVYKGYFDRTVIFSPTAENDPAYKGIAPKRDYKVDLKPAEIKHLFQTQKNKVKAMGKSHAPRMLILFDDVIADNKFMNTPDFMKCFFQSRHHNISIILCAQSYMRVPRSARLNATDLCLFPASESEIKRIGKEYCPPHTSQRSFEDLIRHATAERFSFLYINTQCDPEKRFRRKFDAVLTLDADDEPVPEPSDTTEYGSDRPPRRRKGESSRN